MSHIYTPSAAGPITASYNHADDGDTPPSVAAFNAPLEALADDVQFLNRYYSDDGAADWINVPLGNPIVNSNTRWAFDTSLGLWVQADDTDAGELWWPVPLPFFKGRIVETNVTLDGDIGAGAGSHAGLPGTVPIATWYRVDAATGALSTLATDTDNAANAADYDAAHSFGSTGLTEDFDATSGLAHYYVKFTGEMGANSLPDELGILSLRIRIARTP